MPVVVQQLTVTKTYVFCFFFETETYILGLFITDVCNAFVREKENGRERERKSRTHTNTQRCKSRRCFITKATFSAFPEVKCK